MADELDFIQIIYEDIQAEHCYPFARIYKNESLTPYFENEIIARLAPTCTERYVSINSWRLAQKRGDMYRLLDKTLNERGIIMAGETTQFDVAILTPRGHKDIKHKFLIWHKTESALRALKEFNKFIRFPDEVKNAIYENHFIAKRDLYQEYVSTCLIPAMEFMNERPEIFMADAGYINRKSGAEREAMLKKLAVWGKVDYPISPFLLERLFSIWIDKKNLKVIAL